MNDNRIKVTGTIWIYACFAKGLLNKDVILD